MSRKKIQNHIIKGVNEIDPSGFNGNIYKSVFAKMSDEEFKTWHQAIKDGEMTLGIIVKHKGSKITHARNLKLLKSKGMKTFHHLTIDEDGKKRVQRVTTQVLLLPLRRVKQTVYKGRSFTKDNKTRNVMTGTVAGSSAAGKLSFDEIKIMSSLGLDKTITEIFKVTGGDAGAENALVQLAKHGMPTLKSIKPHSTGVQSISTFQQLMASAGLKFDF